LKNIYSRHGNYIKVINLLQNIGCEFIPSSKELKDKIKDSFNSEEEYKNWTKFIDWKLNITFESSLKYFKDVIYPQMQRNLNLAENQAPTQRQLIKNGHGYFVDNVHKLGLNKIYKEAGLTLNHETYINEPTKDKIANYYIKEIYPKMKKKYNLLANEAPTRRQLEENGYDFFFGALYRIDTNYNDILKKVGLKPNLEKNKWDWLTLESGAEYFMKEIYPKFKIKYNLAMDEAPRINEYNDEFFSPFMRALREKKISYFEMLEKCGLIPNYHNISIDIGNNAHLCVEQICLKHTRDLGCSTFRQPKTNKKSNEIHPDFSIIRNEVYKKQIESKQNIIKFPKEIELINIDFCLGKSMDIFVQKCKRGYQGYKKMLILVPFRASEDFQQEIPKDQNIFLKKNIKILNPKKFADFMGFKDKELIKFNNIITLINDALYNSQSREELAKLAKEKKEIMKRQYCFANKEFQEYVKNKNLTYLLQNDMPITKTQLTLDTPFKNKNITNYDKINLYIEKICKNCGLTPKTKDAAVKIFEDFSNNRTLAIGKRSLKGIAAAIVYLGSKRCDELISIRKIAKYTNLTRSVIGNRIRELS